MRSVFSWLSNAASASAFFVLMPNLPFLGAHRVHEGEHSGQDRLRKMLHQLGIFVDERLALGSVGDHELHLRLRLDIGWKAGPAGAHYPGFAQLLNEHK